MKANKLFSKLNIKNYTNELEKILEEKTFSLDVKNILLSMIYKIENGYKDYTTVKIEVLPQKDFIEHIIKTIKEKCFEIEFISPDGKKEEVIEKKKGIIHCYPNEEALLSAVWYMGEIEPLISVPYKYTKKAMQEMITIGNNISQVEVLRDFNGWSWDTIVNEIENIPYNILYQTLLLLDGKEILYASINNNAGQSIFSQNDRKKYEELFEAICSTTLKIYSKANEKVANEIENIKEEKEKQLILFKNKKEFVEKVANEKREASKQIENIDKIINDKERLKEEYQERNKKLPNKEKIFSISHLTDRMEKEKEELLEKIRTSNRMATPKEFVYAKTKLEEEVNFLNREVSVIDCCKAFLQCVQKEIKELQEENDIIKWIYKIRYYYYLPFYENKYLKDIEELEQDFKEVIKTLIKKAQENKIWDIFTEDEEIAYIVIKELFHSRMIGFENVNMLCTYENGILHIEYYDGNILETKSEFKIENVRIKKKIKLFM